MLETRRVLDPSLRDREAAMARRWRHLREGLPPGLFLLAGGGALLVVMILTGFGVSRVFHDDALGRADASLAAWFAGQRTATLDTVTDLLGSAADTPMVIAFAVLAAVVAAFVHRRWREPVFVAAAVGGEVLIFLLVTLVVDRTRPPVPQLDPAPPTSSFPSGHTAAAICLYGALGILINERARSAVLRMLATAAAVAMPVIVAASRVYRGMHYVTDVLGGVLLGAVWLVIVLRGVRLGVLHHELRGEST